MFGYDFKTRPVSDIPPLRASKMSKTGSSVVTDIPGHEVRRLFEIQFVSITSYEAESVDFGGASGWGCSTEVVFATLSVLDDPKLLFDRASGWTEDADTVKPELQKRWWLLRDEPLCLQMTVPTDSLGQETFARRLLKRTSRCWNEYGCYRGRLAEQKSTKLKSSVLASDALAGKLVEFEN